MLRQKKLTAIFALLCSLSLLVAWDVHTLRRQARESPYDDRVTEVRRYNGGEGIFHVLYSRLRDANEANILMAAKSNAVDISYTKNSESMIYNSTPKKYFGKKIEEKAKAIFKPLKPDSDGVIFRNYSRNSTSSAIIKDGDPSLDDKYSSQAKETVTPYQPSPDKQPTGVQEEMNFKSVPDSDDFKRKKMAVEDIKTLLLQNETERARTLWRKAQQQHAIKSTTSAEYHAPSRSKTEGRKKRRNLFSIQSTMSWPVPQYTKSDVLQSKWVGELKNYLEAITTDERQISVVTANQEHQEIVLNWLVSAVTVAKLPLRNILVLSLSTQLHDLLKSKKLNSIHISPSSVITEKGLKRITTAFNQIHIVRLTLFRLMNHWKYDVVMYDSDAVVLRNPQPLFDNSPDVQLIGSAGKGPESIGRSWGRTICTGVLLMRSSPGTESWWEQMSKVAHLPFTDQGLVNLALKSLRVHWDQLSPLKVDRDMRGSCSDAQLKALILSEEKICRYSCDSHKRNQYYVWHKPAIKRKRTPENKKQRARDGGAWFLRDDWMEVSKMSSLTGVTWLLAISHNT